jgi:hypothetical protein
VHTGGRARPAAHVARRGLGKRFGIDGQPMPPAGSSAAFLRGQRVEMATTGTGKDRAQGFSRNTSCRAISQLDQDGDRCLTPRAQDAVRRQQLNAIAVVLADHGGNRLGSRAASITSTVRAVFGAVVGSGQPFGQVSRSSLSR